MRYLAVALVLLAACGAGRPSVASWVEERWEPLVEVVPQPGNATPSVCDDALAKLRDRAASLDPAPSEEVQEVAHGWLTAAESLMFACASEPDLDYTARHERLLLRQAEVEAVIQRS